MAEAIKNAGVMPELEVFETGHLLLAKRFHRAGLRQAAGHVPDLPGHFLGPAGDAGGHDLLRNLLPPDSPWFAFGISLHQFPMVAQTALLGGHPRVGLEDNIYLEKGKLAPSNAALVEKAAQDHRGARRFRRHARRSPAHFRAGCERRLSKFRLAGPLCNGAPQRISMTIRVAAIESATARAQRRRLFSPSGRHARRRADRR